MVLIQREIIQCDPTLRCCQKLTIYVKQYFKVRTLYRRNVSAGLVYKWSIKAHKLNLVRQFVAISELYIEEIAELVWYLFAKNIHAYIKLGWGLKSTPCHECKRHGEVLVTNLLEYS